VLLTSCQNHDVKSNGIPVGSGEEEGELEDQEVRRTRIPLGCMAQKLDDVKP
jgi:hypothetical protein